MSSAIELLPEPPLQLINSQTSFVDSFTLELEQLFRGEGIDREEDVEEEGEGDDDYEVGVEDDFLSS